MTSVQGAAKRLGISYRRVDYWCSQGLVPGAGQVVGSGNVRPPLTDRQIEHLGVMRDLVLAGMNPRAASRLTVRLMEKGQAQIGQALVLQYLFGPSPTSGALKPGIKLTEEEFQKFMKAIEDC